MYTGEALDPFQYVRRLVWIIPEHPISMFKSGLLKSVVL
jgi:hypothetical protein